jgi:uncharacterized membrane protein YhiD involved in acid resistance
MTEYELLLRPTLALAAGGLVGLERSFHGRAAGLRTYALVSFASALLVGIAQVLDPRGPAAIPMLRASFRASSPASDFSAPASS